MIGVYISYDNCESFYVGQTYESLTTIVALHKNNVRTAQENNAIFCHYRYHDHQVSWKNSLEMFLLRIFTLKIGLNQ